MPAFEGIFPDRLDTGRQSDGGERLIVPGVHEGSAERRRAVADHHAFRRKVLHDTRRGEIRVGADGHRSELRPAERGPIIDGPVRLADEAAFSGARTVKGRTPDPLHPAAERHVGQRRAALEGLVVDLGQALAEGDGLKRRAALEGVHVDIAERVRQHDLL